MRRDPYRLAAICFLGLTFSVAVVTLVAASPEHDRDPLFWFMCFTTALLVVLGVILHNEPSKEDRQRFIRLFFLAEWLLALTMASYALFRVALRRIFH